MENRRRFFVNMWPASSKLRRVLVTSSYLRRNFVEDTWPISWKLRRNFIETSSYLRRNFVVGSSGDATKMRRRFDENGTHRGVKRAPRKQHISCIEQF